MSDEIVEPVGLFSWVRSALARGTALSSPAGEFLAVVLLCPILLVIAFWNGFPIIFYDTGAYILEGLGHVFVAERAPVYSLLLRYAGASHSLWYVAWLQAVLNAFVMTELARAEAPEMPVWKLAAIGVALEICTGLGWYVGQIEPDCMAAMVVISVYLLTFRAHNLGVLRTAAICGVAGLAAASHPANLVLEAVLVFLVALVFLARRALPRLNIPRPALAASLASLCLAVGLVLSANYDLTHKWFLSRSGAVFVFARMLQDGLVEQELADACPASRYSLCAFKGRLPKRADAWLWDGNSPFNKLNRFNGPTSEYQRIVVDSLVRHPGSNLLAAFKDTALQFVTFKTGDQIEPQEWILYSDLAHYIPRQMNAYMRARQQRGELGFASLNRVHVSIAAASLVGLVFFLWRAASRADWSAGVLPGFVLAALLSNAFICGTLSNPHDRYQSRLIWVPVFVVAISSLNWHVVALRKPVESGT